VWTTSTVLWTATEELQRRDSNTDRSKTDPNPTGFNDRAELDSFVVLGRLTVAKLRVRFPHTERRRNDNLIPAQSKNNVNEKLK
jgi:hypothetical protein